MRSKGSARQELALDETARRWNRGMVSRGISVYLCWLCVSKTSTLLPRASLVEDLKGDPGIQGRLHRAHIRQKVLQPTTTGDASKPS